MQCTVTLVQPTCPIGTLSPEASMASIPCASTVGWSKPSSAAVGRLTDDRPLRKALRELVPLRGEPPQLALGRV